MKLKKINFRFADIFYRVSGTGKPVVLIHGFGEDGDIWNRQVDFLMDRYMLIIPDLPGSGRSEMLSGNQGMEIADYAEVIKEILKTELSLTAVTDTSHPLKDLQQVAMLGHSMGGYITLAFAEKYPQWLSSFGLIHSSAFADSEEKKAARLRSIDFIRKNGAYEFLKTAIPGLFKLPANPVIPESYITDLVEKGKNFSAESLTRYYTAMINRPDRTTVLKTFPRPILFIMSVYDQAVPFQQSLQQCYLPGQSYIHILRNSAHMSMLEETDKTNNFLLDFLR